SVRHRPDVCCTGDEGVLAGGETSVEPFGSGDYGRLVVEVDDQVTGCGVPGEHLAGGVPCRPRGTRRPPPGRTRQPPPPVGSGRAPGNTARCAGRPAARARV